MTSQNTPGEPGLARIIMSGARWTYTSLAVSAAVQLIFTAAMSRLLTPRVFGLFAVAMIVVNLSRQLGQLGLGHAIVQQRNVSALHERNVFTASLGLGLCLAALGIGLSGWFATLAGTPDAQPLIFVLALDFVLTGAAITSLSLLRRKLEFRRLALIEICASTSGYLLVGILGALAGLGVWSLALAVIVYDLVSLALGYAYTRHPVRPRLRWHELSPFVAYGGTLTIVGVLEYLHSILDTLAIARYWGPAPLGQYNRAFSLISIPFSRIAAGLSRVLFPTFSSAQGSPQRIRPGYRLAFLSVGGLLGALGGGLAAGADEVVLLLLGDQWPVAASLLPLTVAIVTTTTLAMFGGVVADALGRVRLRLTIQTASLGVLILGIGVTATRGIVPILFAVTAANFLRFLLYVGSSGFLLGIPFPTQVADLARVLTATAATHLTVALSAKLMHDAALLPSLAVMGSGGLATLAVLWWLGPFRSVRRDLATRIAPTLPPGRFRSIVRRLA